MCIFDITFVSTNKGTMKAVKSTNYKNTKQAFYSLVDLCKSYGLDVEADSAASTQSYYITATLGNYDKLVEIRISDHTKPMSCFDLSNYPESPIHRNTLDEFSAEILTQENFESVFFALEIFLLS